MFFKFFSSFLFSLLPSSRSLLHMFPKSKHTTKVSLEYVTNSTCVCELIIKDHWKKRKKHKKREKESTTTNGELFSSASFDLIIYFCVVENFGFVQIRISLGGRGGGVRAHVGSYHCCLFSSHTHTHS